MAFRTTREGTRFVVDFGDIPVPALMAAELEGEFQRLALSVLARTDFRGGVRIGRLPTGLYGYVFDPGGQPFPDDDGAQLSVQDHTAIVATLLQRPLPVVRAVAGQGRQTDKKRTKPSWEAVLQAILELLGPPASTRRAIETTLRTGKVLAGVTPDPKAQAALDGVNRQIDRAGGLDDLLGALRRMQREDDGAVDGLGVGLRVAQEILEDGRDTIYSPEFGFYPELGDPTVAYSVGKEDVKGAVGGGVVGAGVGAGAAGVGAVGGAVTGAVTGAVGASLSEAVGELLDWLF